MEHGNIEKVTSLLNIQKEIANLSQNSLYNTNNETRK